VKYGVFISGKFVFELENHNYDIRCVTLFQAKCTISTENAARFLTPLLQIDK